MTRLGSFKVVGLFSICWRKIGMMSLIIRKHDDHFYVFEKNVLEQLSPYHLYFKS